MHTCGAVVPNHAGIILTICIANKEGEVSTLCAKQKFVQLVFNDETCAAIV